MQLSQLKVIPLKALTDNYIWIIHSQDNQSVLVVDPGEATPVIHYLEKTGLSLKGIFVTHHHGDHCHGVSALVEKYQAPVYWGKDQKSNEMIEFSDINLAFRAIKIPGHTLDHTAYYGQGALFCGDTLFTGGCGRVFEGTIPQMYGSLSLLAALPQETLIYCGHEYTEANLKFALAVEPDNKPLQERMAETQQLRAKDLPTVPSFLSIEKMTNPFLRCHIPTVISAAEHYADKKLVQPAEVFGVLREWKNHF